MVIHIHPLNRHILSLLCLPVSSQEVTVHLIRTRLRCATDINMSLWSSRMDYDIGWFPAAM